MATWTKFTMAASGSRNVLSRVAYLSPFHVQSNLAVFSCRPASMWKIKGRKAVRQLKRQLREEDIRNRAPYEEKFAKDVALTRKIEFDVASMETRGFLRGAKPYSPPADVEEKILKTGRSLFDVPPDVRSEDVALKDRLKKFKLLTHCIKEFEHDLPSSQMNKMKSLADVVNYYLSPVKMTNSFDELLTMDLPPNLHVQPNYVRFHPDTDTKFGGISAYPGVSTIVTGLKAKKLYKGYSATKLAAYLTNKLKD